MIPVSITASVVGIDTTIARTIATIDYIIKHSKSGSSEFHVLKGEMKSVASVFYEVQGYLGHAEITYNKATLTHIFNTTNLRQELDTCKATLVPLQVRLRDISKKLTGNPYKRNMHRLFWHWKRSELVELRDNVQRSRSSIVLTNLMWALKDLDDIKSASVSQAQRMDYLQAQTRKLKGEIRDIGANFRPTSFPTIPHVLPGDLSIGGTNQDRESDRAKIVENGLDAWLADLAKLRTEVSADAAAQDDRVNDEG